jgi:hypothetical protein
MLRRFRNITGEFEHGKNLSGIVSVYDVGGEQCRVYNDMSDGHFLIAIG